MWNGFFPPGYPFLLAVLPGRRLIQSAYYLNVIAGVGLVLAAGWFLHRRVVWWLALAGMLLTGTHPLVLTQVLTTGPDAPFVALSTAGALLLYQALVSDRARLAIGAGVALGAAGWLRYHAFPWAAGLLIAAALVGWSRGRITRVATAGAVILVFGLALVTLGIAAGDLASLQRDAAFNTHTRLIQAPNWFHLPAPGNLPQTVGAAIAANPEVFWRNYTAFSAPHIWLFVTPFLAVLVGTAEARRFGIFTLIAAAFFVPVVNLGASPRGVACVVPLMVIAGIWAVADVATRLPARLRPAFAALAVVVVGVMAQAWWRPEITAYLDAARFRAAMSRELEAKLRADRVKFGMQVFATTELYFLGASGWQVGNYHPRIIGGWPTFDLPGYNETYPPLDTSSLDSLLDDCQRYGVTHLALGTASSLVTRELGQLFDGRLGSSRVVEIAGFPGVRLFRIVE